MPPTEALNRFLTLWDAYEADPGYQYPTDFPGLTAALEALYESVGRKWQ